MDDSVLTMDETTFLDRIDDLTKDEKLVKELKKELTKDKALERMMNIFELDEIARVNPFDVYNALENKKLSRGAEEFKDLCFKVADSAHAEAAKKRKDLGLEGGKD